MPSTFAGFGQPQQQNTQVKGNPQQYQQALTAWTMPKQDVMQWGKQNNATFQAPGTQQQGLQKQPFQQTVQSPFGSQGNWTQGRDAFMAAGFNQQAQTPVGYFGQPRQNNNNWTPQYLMQQGQNLTNSGWTNPFAQQQLQIPQFDPTNYTMPLFGPGGMNIGQQRDISNDAATQDRMFIDSSVPVPYRPGGQSYDLRPQPRPEPPRRFDTDSIASLFQNAGIQAPPGFMDQLIRLLGGQSTQTQLPGPPAPAPAPQTQPPFAPAPPVQPTIYYGEDGRATVSASSLAAPGEYTQAVMLPVDEYNRRARARGMPTISAPARGQGAGAPTGSGAVDPGRAQSIAPPSTGTPLGESKKKDESTAVRPTAWASMDPNARRGPENAPGPFGMGKAGWDALDNYWQGDGAVTDRQRKLASFNPTEIELAISSGVVPPDIRKDYREALNRVYTQQRWQSDPEYMRKIHQQNHALSWGTEERQNEIRAQIDAERAAGGRPAAMDPAAALFGRLENTTLIKKQLEKKANELLQTEEGVPYDRLYERALREHSPGVGELIDAFRAEGMFKRSEISQLRQDAAATWNAEKEAYDRTGVLPERVRENMKGGSGLSRYADLQWLEEGPDRGAEWRDRWKRYDTGDRSPELMRWIDFYKAREFEDSLRYANNPGMIRRARPSG